VFFFFFFLDNNYPSLRILNKYIFFLKNILKGKEKQNLEFREQKKTKIIKNRRIKVMNYQSSKNFFFLF